MKRLSVLGSTGSVGSQTLQIVKAYREDFELVGIVAKRSSDKLLKQAKELNPKYVVSFEEPTKDWLRELPKGTEYMFGEEGLLEVIKASDMVMNSISGTDGILPTYWTLTMGKRLLASNKESIICLRRWVKEHKDQIVPVDSEHNALFQLLSFVKREDIKKVYLTASGGPFRQASLEELKKVKVEDALKHPTWKMGHKITVDSATLFNKGMEIIEAINLFDLELDQLEVVIHPQSVVHGIVELRDCTFLFHTSQTDMRVPILYSLYYPERKTFPFERKSLFDLSPITFEKVDTERFRSVSLCKWVATMGGPYPALLVGADQSAVELFLEGKIGFLDITNLVEEVLSLASLPEPERVEDVLYTIDWAYKKGKELAGALR
ncbi:MAG: 1-deoxy-D-xylulose-5-phosphate reductoisomerase [Aquificota bacterium]|nr:MAG: 1-deoxy-D-xylulose-5-phosphate reductoisomerase [Aquificota bacterium]